MTKRSNSTLKLPDLGRSLGASIAEFKRGIRDIHSTLDSPDQ